MQNYRMVLPNMHCYTLHNTCTVCYIDGIYEVTVYTAEVGLIYAEFGNTSEAMMSRTVKVEVEGK